MNYIKHKEELYKRYIRIYQIINMNYTNYIMELQKQKIINF